MRGECGPVDAGGCQPLRRIGAGLAQPRFIARPGLLPEAVEHRPAIGVDLLHREHRKIAMLRVDPGHGAGAAAGQARRGGATQQ
jgi:hypothetical protein